MSELHDVVNSFFSELDVVNAIQPPKAEFPTEESWYKYQEEAVNIAVSEIIEAVKKRIEGYRVKLDLCKNKQVVNDLIDTLVKELDKLKQEEV